MIAARNHRPQQPSRRSSAFGRLSRPLLTSAAGRAYLAFCPAPQREALIDILARSDKEEDAPGAPAAAQLQRMLAEISGAGLRDHIERTRRPVEEISLSVPVPLDERVLAVPDACDSPPPPCRCRPRSNVFCRSCASARPKSVFHSRNNNAEGAPQAARLRSL